MQAETADRILEELTRDARGVPKCRRELSLMLEKQAPANQKEDISDPELLEKLLRAWLRVVYLELRETGSWPKARTGYFHRSALRCAYMLGKPELLAAVLYNDALIQTRIKFFHGAAIVLKKFANEPSLDAYQARGNAMWARALLEKGKTEEAKKFIKYAQRRGDPQEEWMQRFQEVLSAVERHGNVPSKLHLSVGDLMWV